MCIDEKFEGPGEVGGVLQLLTLVGDDVSELDSVPFMSNDIGLTLVCRVDIRLLSGKRSTTDEAP